MNYINLIEENLNIINFILNFSNDHIIEPFINIFENNFNFLINEIIHLLLIYPFKKDNIINFCLKINNYLTNFKKNIFQSCIDRIPFLIYKLYKNNFFEKDLINNFFKKQPLKLFHFYFFDFCDLKKLYINSSKNIRIKFSKFENILDDKLLLKQKIEFGWIYKSIGYCIKFDEINDFISMINEKNRNLLIDVDLFEYFLQEGSYSLISLCASYGSINCFKHLFLKKCNLNFVENCFIGGNLEILHLVGNFSFNNIFINFSIYYRNYDMFEWLLNTYSQKIPDYSIFFLYNDIRGLFIYLKYFDIDLLDIKFKSLLHYSSEFKLTNPLIYFLNNKANPNIKNNQVFKLNLMETLLYIFVQIIIFLMELNIY